MVGGNQSIQWKPTQALVELAHSAQNPSKIRTQDLLAVQHWCWPLCHHAIKDWKYFRSAATQDNISLEKCTSLVTSYMKCVDDLGITKAVRSLPNHKSWMNWEVTVLSRVKTAAFQSGDNEAHSTVRARLKVGMKKAKMSHQQRLGRDLNTNSTVEGDSKCHRLQMQEQAPCVRPHCQISLIHFMLTSISATKT